MSTLPEHTPDNSDILSSYLDSTDEFEIIDHKDGYVIYTDPKQAKEDPDPEQRNVYKVLSDTQVAFASMGRATSEGLMSGLGPPHFDHSIPEDICNWLNEAQ
tara:strand:- start:10410 stop:10715 length:306 start_codon:yes stop_codon:yes gene_type:complete